MNDHTWQEITELTHRLSRRGGTIQLLCLSVMILTCIVKGMHEILIKIGVHNTHRGLHQILQQIPQLFQRRLGPTRLQIIAFRGGQETIVYPVSQGVVLQ